MENTSFNIIIILGPTAAGKTKLAAALAAHYDTEMISADSRQVYRHMNIGTGKDYDDYIVDGKKINCKLIDIREPVEEYNLHEYMKDFSEAFNDIIKTGKVPVLCGGTSLYIDAVLKGYAFSSVPVNKELRDELNGKSKEALLDIFKAEAETSYTELADTSTAKRLIRAIEISRYLNAHPHEGIELPVLKPVVIGLHANGAERDQMISERLKQRLNAGLIDEVKLLIKKGISKERLKFFGLEYKFAVDYLDGLFDEAAFEEKLHIAIRQFARRQMTFFRKMEREGLKIHWIGSSLSPHEKIERALEVIDRRPGKNDQ